VAAQRYFRGQIPLGGLVQPATAFAQVQDALSFIVSSYTDIAEWRAVVERLSGFERALQQAGLESARGSGIARADGDPGRLSLDGVEVDRPDGLPLIADVTLSLALGDTALRSGYSGGGLSSL